MKEKLKLIWKILTGKMYVSPKSEVIYVHDNKANNQFVQLLAWRDTIIALDAQGKIWELRQDYPGGYGFTCQYLQDSPDSRYL